MSRNSKAKRDARKKKEPKRPIRRLGAPLQPHAQLTDAQGNAIGGAGWRDGQWLMVLGGQVVARTPSAAMTMAMLRHVVALQAQSGVVVHLTQSPAMVDVATKEAAALGQTLDEYLQQLEQERVERAVRQDDQVESTHGESERADVADAGRVDVPPVVSADDELP
ncbi:hypothetical protein [Lysobacter fragariae]